MKEKTGRRRKKENESGGHREKRQGVERNVGRKWDEMSQRGKKILVRRMERDYLRRNPGWKGNEKAMGRGRGTLESGVTSCPSIWTHRQVYNMKIQPPQCCKYKEGAKKDNDLEARSESS